MNRPRNIVDSVIKAAPFRGRESGNCEHYAGLPVYALPGLHAFAARHLQNHLAPPARILELGAGTGAMSLRLLDLGYSLIASDVLEVNFIPRDRVDFIAADLNMPFAAPIAERFDAIVCLELIEHLENPRHTLRQCRQLLKPGGLLLLSTPNATNPVSQAMFVRTGQFQWFSDADYEQQGHILPLTLWLLAKCFREIGFTPVWEGSFGDPFQHLGSWPRMRWLARIVARLAATPAHLRGEIYVAVLRAPGDGV
jgi:SAM-dependent methyltransferase